MFFRGRTIGTCLLDSSGFSPSKSHSHFPLTSRGPSESRLQSLSPPAATRLPFLTQRSEHVTQGLVEAELCFGIRSAPQRGSHRQVLQQAPAHLSSSSVLATLHFCLSLSTYLLHLENTCMSFKLSPFLKAPLVPFSYLSHQILIICYFLRMMS